MSKLRVVLELEKQAEINALYRACEVAVDILTGINIPYSQQNNLAIAQGRIVMQLLEPMVTKGEGER